MKIIKRNGAEVLFDQTKITAAIEKANNEVVGKDRLSDEDIDNLLNEIDECVERHNQQAYQDAKTFYDPPHKRLQEAIRECEEENEK